VADVVRSRLERQELLANISAGAVDRERNDIEPWGQLALLRDSGLTTMTLPVELGGMGGTISDLVSFILELAEADPIVAHVLRAHYLQIQLVRRLADTQTQRRWAREIASGKLFGNAAGEREGTLGASPQSTRLEPSNGGWRLNGNKFYCTGTAYSDYVAVVAQLDDVRGARVVLPVDRPGIEVVDDWDGIGQNRTGTGTTRFTDVQVLAEDVLVISDPNDPQVVSDAPLMQLYLQAIMVGCLAAGISDASDLLRSRKRTFDNAPAQEPTRDPLLLATIGRAAASTYAARAAVMAAASDIDLAYDSARSGVADPALFARASASAALVKVHVDDVALSTSSAIFDVGGASGASRARNLDRHWRSIRTLTLHNPAAYKALAIGDLLINGAPLPANGYF
jgi:alkylation response protein AidB-like acyl-CoA dehydrogenase